MGIDLYEQSWFLSVDRLLWEDLSEDEQIRIKNWDPDCSWVVSRVR